MDDATPPPFQWADLLTDPLRVLLVARPAVGRPLARVLQGAGYTVFRTPDVDDLSARLGWLRPHVLLVVLPLPWLDVDAVRQTARTGPQRVPLLVLGDGADTASLGDGSPPLTITDPAEVLRAIVRVVADDQEPRGPQQS